MSRQQNQPNQGHQFVGGLVVIATIALAAVIVIVTRDTAGLVDLATLVLAISSVVVQLVTGRRTRRGKH